MTDASPSPHSSDSRDSDAVSALTVVHNLQGRLLEAEHTLRRGRRGVRRPRRGMLMTLIFVAVILGPFVCLWAVYVGLAQEGSTTPHLFWSLCQPDTPSAARRQALLDLIERGHGEWRSAYLEGLDLSQAELGGARLRSADLRGCDLRGARLKKAALMMANLETVDLSNADLELADLRGARLGKHTRMVAANLTGANLRGVSLASVHAPGARFVNAGLRGADFELAELSAADFTEADLRKANLHVANLRGANLSGARIKGARLDDADLTDTNWWRARGLKKHLPVLQARFAPTDASPDALRQDYERWLREDAEKSSEPADLEDD